MTRRTLEVRKRREEEEGINGDLQVKGSRPFRCNLWQICVAGGLPSPNQHPPFRGGEEVIRQEAWPAEEILLVELPGIFRPIYRSERMHYI